MNRTNWNYKYMYNTNYWRTICHKKQLISCTLLAIEIDFFKVTCKHVETILPPDVVIDKIN